MTTFLNYLDNTLIVACIAIVIAVALRMMCNIKKNAIGEKITWLYGILFYSLGVITGIMIIGYLVILFMNVDPFPVWYQNLITLMVFTVVALALLAKRKSKTPKA